MSEQAKFTASAPVLLVRDVAEAAEHYRTAMGFTVGRFYGEPPSFTIIARDGMHLMLKQVPDARHVVPHWTVSAGLWDAYFWVDDVEALYREFVKRGAKIDYGLCDHLGFGQVVPVSPGGPAG